MWANINYLFYGLVKSSQSRYRMDTVSPGKVEFSIFWKLSFDKKKKMNRESEVWLLKIDLFFTMGIAHLPPENKCSISLEFQIKDEIFGLP